MSTDPERLSRFKSALIESKQQLAFHKSGRRTAHSGIRLPVIPYERFLSGTSREKPQYAGAAVHVADDPYLFERMRVRQRYPM